MEKVKKRIPSYILLLKLSATMTKDAWFQVLTKAGFCDEYKLIQTFFNCSEIQQIYCFMAHPNQAF